MKVTGLILLTICLFIVSVGFQSRSENLDNIGLIFGTKCYEIHKIDSVGNYYLLYANAEGSPYKIVTDRRGKKPSKGIKVSVGSCYELKLIDIRDTFPGGHNLLITDFGLEDGTYVSIEPDSIWTVHLCKDITGLHIK
ncbi:MAG: hypothetical protein AAFN93_29440 [Bacteroidota bacterium]